MENACSICLCKYTTIDHHAVSLICGHVFGSSCVDNWFQKKRTANCPSCFKKCKKNEIRRIFSTNIATVSSSEVEWLINRYTKQKNYLKKLTKYTELLFHYKKSRRAEKKIDCENLTVDQLIEWKRPVSQFIFDEVFGLVIFIEEGRHNEIKKYSFMRKETVMLARYNARISAMHRCIIDNTYMVVTTDYMMQLIDYVNGNVIKYLTFSSLISNCMFYSEEKLLISFLDGKNIFYDMISKKLHDWKISMRIFSMARGHPPMFATPNGIYRHEEKDSLDRVTSDVAIKMVSSANTVVYLMRDREDRLHLKTIGIVNSEIPVNFKYPGRKIILVYKKFVFVSDGAYFFIFNLAGGLIKTFDVKHDITAMHINKNRLVVFTEKNLIVYK